MRGAFERRILFLDLRTNIGSFRTALSSRRLLRENGDDGSQRIGTTMNDRRSEWFVPKFGPPRLRAFVGLLFLPYTGMVISYAIIGSLLVRSVHWERVLWIAVIYFLGLGIAAHALDALGSKGTKPWGRTFTRRQLVLAALFSLVTAYLIAVYYMIYYVPWLSIVAVLEGFFVFRLQSGVVQRAISQRRMVWILLGFPPCSCR